MEFKIPLNYDLNKHEENYLHNNLQNHNIRGPLRDYEPEVLIHSSTKELSESIIKSGELLSWNSAKERKLLKEETPIGKDLGDPEDFKNYVMLGSPGVVSEIVVLSKYLKKLCFDENHVYEPGVRFYFDAKKLASDNILVRDGLHLKVRDGFKINKYLIHKVFPSSDVEWTPKSFSEYADQIVLDKGQ
jgi:hypothetical protein